MSPFKLPPDLVLRDARQLAKQVFKAAASGDPRVLAKFAAISKEPSLTAAQLVVAREYGFSSWAKLKQQVERNEADPGSAAIRRARKRRDRIPEDEGCGVVPVGVVAAVTPRVSLAVSAILVYSACFVVELQWAHRRVDESAQVWRALSGSVFGNPFDPYPDAEIGRATVTVDYSDGRSVDNRSDDWIGPVRAHPEVEMPVLVCRGRSGSAAGDSGWHCRGHLLLSPLPPPGELRLTFDWPAFELSDISVSLDADTILAAAGRVRRFPGGER